MAAQIPQRGADPVNDELEVGFNLTFERSWHFAEIAGRAFVALVVLAALAGMLGRGPFSHRTAHSAGGLFTVDYEPIARYGTPTQVTLHLTPPPGPATRTVDVRLDTKFVEPLGFQNTQPMAAREDADGSAILLHVAVPPAAAESSLRIYLRPTVVGPVTASITYAGVDRLRLKQWVVP